MRDVLRQRSVRRIAPIARVNPRCARRARARSRPHSHRAIGGVEAAHLLETMISPIEDGDTLSNAERKAVGESDEWLKHNEPIPHEEVLAEFGLTMADWEKMGSEPMPEETPRRNGSAHRLDPTGSGRTSGLGPARREMRANLRETGSVAMRLRTAQGKLKIEHSIIDGVAELLKRLLAQNPEIRTVIPGVIRPVRDARGEVRVHVTLPTVNGWKAIALSAGARQELFISTNLGKEQLEQALERALESLR